MPDAVIRPESQLTALAVAGIFRPMKDRNKAVVFALALMAAGVAAPSVTGFAAETSNKSERPNLYDTRADGKEQIANALKMAKAEDKRIILKFGANW